MYLRTCIAAAIAIVVLASGCETGSSSSQRSAAKTETAVVIRVVDGDSVELEIDGEVKRARLIGINAPELADCQGPAARNSLSAVTLGEMVELREYGNDRFGRLLVELIVDGDSINGALVRTGWAFAVHGDEADWTADMVQAADAGLGMWDMPDVCPLPAATLEIGDIEPDPPGPDDEVLNEEWIEIENPGEDTVSLEGWALRDESTSNRFEFTQGQLEPEATLRLRTGCGEDTQFEVHWCSSNGVWSNRGETAVLLAPSGAIVDYVVVDR